METLPSLIADYLETDEYEKRGTTDVIKSEVPPLSLDAIKTIMVNLIR